MTHVHHLVQREEDAMAKLRARLAKEEAMTADLDCIHPHGELADAVRCETVAVADNRPAAVEHEMTPASIDACDEPDTPAASDLANEEKETDETDKTVSEPAVGAEVAVPTVAPAGHAGPTRSLPDGYARFDDGLFLMPDDANAEPIHICSPIRVDSVFADRHRRGWGKVIAVKSPDGDWHEIDVTNEDLVRWPVEVIGRLVHHGLELASGKLSKDRLIGFLKACKPEERLLAVTRMGWVDDTFCSFIVGDEVLGNAKVLSRVPATGIADGLAAEGTLESWRENVGLKCSGNPLMIAAVSLAFTGPLLAPLNIDGGGLHFRGASSTGKTTLLRLAASVWGSRGLVTQWRATSNGIEAIAATLNDLLLPLDELAEISARDLDKSIYMLANGTGKARMTKDTLPADPNRWRVALISSGEISIEEKLRESRRHAMAGHEVRLIDIEADARPFGAFDNLHGAGSASAFAETVNAAVRASHGSAGRFFVQKLVNLSISSKASKIEDAVRGRVRAWLGKLPGAPDSQAERVARRFAVIGVAGHLATGIGITGWDRDEAINASESLFLDWYDRHYGEKQDSAGSFVKTLQVYLAANRNDLRKVGGSGSDDPVGWFDETRAYLPAQTWSRIYPGSSGTEAARALIDVHVLQPGDGTRPMKRAPRAILGRPRLYTVNTDRLKSYTAR